MLRCVMLSIVHDLAEAQVGDIAPSEGFSKQQKQALGDKLSVHIDSRCDDPAYDFFCFSWRVVKAFGIKGAVSIE